MKDDIELGAASIKGVLTLIADTLRWVLRDRVAQVIGSAFVLIMLWGTHGNVDLLSLVVDRWTGPGGDPAQRAQLIPGLPWDQEWIAFGIGVLLLVVVPCLLIRFAFQEKLSDYGLGLPRPGTWGFTAASTLLLSGLAIIGAYGAAHDQGMRAIYPFYRQFASLHDFLIYEAGYFFFFLVIEFTFRGYLLFGLYRAKDSSSGQGALGEAGPLVFGRYAILISMLSYTAWHLGKPLAEQFGTLLWGLVTGAMVLRSGTIWHIVLVHFAMNVGIDYLIWTSILGSQPV